MVQEYKNQTEPLNLNQQSSNSIAPSNQLKYSSQQQFILIINNFPQKSQVNNKNTQKHLSKYYQEYLNYFLQVDSQASCQIQKCNSSEESKLDHKLIILKKDQIDENTFNEPVINIIGNQLEGLIFKYQIIIGNYKLELDLLNVKQNAPQNLKQVGCGSYGEIFSISFNLKQIIVSKRKCFLNECIIREINRTNKQLWKIKPTISEINEVICELSLYKICSFYNISPKICHKFGFDLVCFQNAIQFYMEYCDQSEYYDNKTFKELKKCIRIMHRLRLIHKDIKPANVLYSYQIDSYVITDFGISHFIKQTQGYKSSTFQQGTKDYMCKQMMKIGKQQQFIDLYYNDMHGLSVTFNEIQSKHKFVQNIPRITKANKINYNFPIYINIYIFNLVRNKQQSQLVKLFRKLGQKILESPFIKIILSHIQLAQFFNSIFNIFKENESLKQVRHKISILQKKCQPNHKQNIQFLVRCCGFTEKLIRQLNSLETNNPYINEIRIKCYDNYEFKQHSQQKLNASFPQLKLRILKQIYYYRKMELKLKKQYYNKKIFDKIWQLLMLQSVYEYGCQRQKFVVLFNELKERSKCLIIQDLNHAKLKIQICQIFRRVKFREQGQQKNLRRLKNILKKYPEEKFSLLNSAIIIFQINGNLLSAIVLLEMIIQQYQNIDNVPQLIKNINQMIILQKYLIKPNINTKLKYLKLLKSNICRYFYQSTHLNQKFSIQCVVYMGNIQYEYKNYKLATQYYLVALKRWPQMGLQKNISYALLLLQLGRCYIRNKDYEKSEEYILKSLVLSKMMDYVQNSISCYQDLCEIQIMNNNESKLDFYYNELSLKAHLQYKNTFEINNVVHEEFPWKMDLINKSLEQIKYYLQKLNNAFVQNYEIPQEQSYTYNFVAYANFYRELSIFQVQKKTLSHLNKVINQHKQQNGYLALERLNKNINEKQQTIKRCFELTMNIFLQISKTCKFSKGDIIHKYTIFQDIMKIIELNNNKTKLKICKFGFQFFSKFRQYQKNSIFYLQQIFKCIKFHKSQFTHQEQYKQLFPYLQYLHYYYFRTSNYKACIYILNHICSMFSQHPKIYKFYKQISECYQYQHQHKHSSRYYFKYVKYKGKYELENVIDLRDKLKTLNKQKQYILYRTYVNILLKDKKQEVKQLSNLKFNQQQEICINIFKKKIKVKSQLQYFKILKYCKTFLKNKIKIPLSMELNNQHITSLVKNILTKLN